MSDFFWIGGELWLDAVNSEWVSNGQRVDGWPDEAALQAWLRQASTHHEEARALREIEVTAASGLLPAMKQLRAALRAASEAAYANLPVPEEAMATINAALLGQGVVSTLESSPNGWHEREALTNPTTGALWLIARSALRSWTAGHLTRLKPCSNPECILWFLDTSKNGTRRWCSMQVCGNRHKVTAHYERQKRDAEA